MVTSTVVDLNGTWELSWQDGERGPARRPGVLERADARPRQTFTARVPGEVHLDLMAAGVIGDPAVGTNCLAARWVEEAVWVYRRTFAAPALRHGERAYLRFDRIELAAVVRLNGAEVGRHDDAFLPACFDVTDRLRAGENLVVVETESGLFAVAERPWEGWGVNNSARLTKRHWLRTVQSSASWDWSQRLLNVGITGGVCLEVAGGVRVDGWATFSELDASLGAGSVTARVFVEGLDDAVVGGLLSVEVEGTKVQAQVPVEIRRGAQRLEVKVAVPRPEPWWPVGHGSPRLYGVRVRLEAGGGTLLEARRSVGFRHIRVNQDPHPSGGRFFIIEVNGKAIFCKGGDFVPADAIPARLDRGRYATLVDRALEANFTMLRIWGGGLYESDDFYELCDERGILVWQEFIFACARYPATDERFVELVRREARYQARRLAHHASLVVWCGNNEIEWGYWSWGYGERGTIAPDHFLYHNVLPRILAEEDGTRFYQPSSPYSPDLHHPNCDDCGDQHPWSIGFADKDFRKYRTMACRFPNEGGIMGPASLPTIRACLGPGQEKPHSFAWEVHENSIAIPSEADGILEEWLGRRIEDLSIEDWAYLGGLLQGIGLGEYIRNFRRRMFSTSSAVFWMYNDCWPMVRSWTVVDYYLRRTPSFHPVRRAFAPLAVALAVEDDNVKVFCVNDEKATDVEVRFGVVRLAGGYPVDEKRRLSATGNASTLAAELPLARLQGLGERSHAAFAVLSLAGREVARDTLFLPLFKEVEWPEARVAVRREGAKAIFSSETFAWRVCVDLDGERRLPDNFFDLLPGVPHELAWPADLGEPKVLRVGNGEVKRG
jgi:beta-mannosidase